MLQFTASGLLMFFLWIIMCRYTTEKKMLFGNVFVFLFHYIYMPQFRQISDALAD